MYVPPAAVDGLLSFVVNASGPESSLTDLFRRCSTLYTRQCDLNMALRVAKTSGYNRIHLETTSKFLEAIALYRKFGFVKNVEANLAQGHDIGLVMDLSTDLPA